MTDQPAYPGAPRWVTVSGIIVGVMVLLVGILMHAGGSPRHHASAGAADGQISPSKVTDDSRASGAVGGHAPPKGGHP